MYAVDIDFAYNSLSENSEVVEFERRYGVTTRVVGRANGWPILHVECGDRKVLEDLLEARDESWRADEIDEVSAGQARHAHEDHPQDADDFDGCPSCRGAYGDGVVI